jgi:hypothetical protein
MCGDRHMQEIDAFDATWRKWLAWTKLGETAWWAHSNRASQQLHHFETRACHLSRRRRIRPTLSVAEPRSCRRWPGSSLAVLALVTLVTAWCLLAVAAIVTASTRCFERACMYFVAAGVAVGLAIVAAIVLAP